MMKWRITNLVAGCHVPGFSHLISTQYQEPYLPALFSEMGCRYLKINRTNNLNLFGVTDNFMFCILLFYMESNIQRLKTIIALIHR